VIPSTRSPLPLPLPWDFPDPPGEKGRRRGFHGPSPSRGKGRVRGGLGIDDLLMQSVTFTPALSPGR
jgi:hypothetical protein